jgi:hypothetical protein
MKGHNYPLMDTKCPCGCNISVYVGVNGNWVQNIKGELMEVPNGTMITCQHCNNTYPADGRVWLHKGYFIWPPNRATDDNFQHVWDRTKQDIKRYVVGTQR